MLLITVIVVYIIIALSMVISLLLNGVRPSKTLGWLLAIFTIPVGGFLLYLMLGRNRRKNKLFPLQNDFFEDLPYDFKQKDLPVLENHTKTVELIQGTSKCPVTNHNEITLLKDGKNTFESIFKALEDAKEHIHLQYYIFEDGLLAQKLLEIFERKVKENVQVRLLYDGIGSYSLSKRYLRKLQKIGVEVVQFLPFRFGRFLSSLNYRNHRKIIVVDNKIGFTGGINISDKYLKGDPSVGKWHDTHLKIEGEAVSYLNRVFISDWFLASKKKVDFTSFNVVKTPEESTSMQIVPSSPDDDFPIMEQVYFSIINGAKKYLYITNPYIIPNHAILQSLETAALSGVDVRLLMSSSTDMKLVDWCVRAYFDSYLKAGIKIYLYPDGILHSKVMISDDTIASVGTANLDNRSLQQNYEANAILYSPLLCKELKADFLMDCSKSKKLTDHLTFSNRPWVNKLIEGSAKLMSPLL
ncbi:cardiolipin synthase [Flagellimonas nanhaiensis]|uniref:Cardiolipin synthase n=1 Tax=Flagellimonas nanhaiensis TaxID=2292706 RepID=A0A371JLV4_9FLAO|nr:cardiolipin synthase [Allomuricauda nanhaiensis]RDY58048.1 cardiolipin synthase [Allomuricauda nanhaiensis]